MRSALRSILLLGLAVAPTLALADPPSTPHPPSYQPVRTPVPPAKAADVSSVDGIVAALYDVISGPVGQPRDWNRMRSLFIPGGRLMAIEPGPDKHMSMYVLSVNDYIAVSGDLLVKVGFHERELARRTETYGHMVDVFSTYSGKGDKDLKEMRGINIIELMNDGQRWWIVSVLWEDEDRAGPLPPRYLTSPDKS